MSKTKRVIIPIKPEVPEVPTCPTPEDFKTYKKVKQELSVFDKVKQFFKQLNSF